MSLFQSVLTRIASMREDSAIRRARRLCGSLARSIWPRWPGTDQLLRSLRVRVGLPVARCSVNGCTLYVDVRDRAIAERILHSRDYEKDETDFVRRTLHEGATFVDVGANIGYFAVLAGKIVGPAGKVICFEPEPHNFHLL